MDPMLHSQPANPSSIYRTWKGRIESGHLTKSQQNTFANYLSGRGKRNNLSRDELYALDALIGQKADRGEMTIDAEQTAQGYAWLRNECYTPAGRVRKRCPLDSRQRAVLDNFSHFELRGFDEFSIMIGNRDLPTSRPVYRVVATDGRYFDYLVTRNRSEMMIDRDLGTQQGRLMITGQRLYGSVGA